ncbi:MAG: anthranilate phosphoribosyltransferase [Candidatus Omnitrophica bacterium]|nr:anthranilate phosphoribosyltransferase [Candidatus Omnitrophota bacterium]MBU4487622.1 anthranilate phosphoribosyltransferase [Candidatus Omnitrophota bacterium]MCG2705045.1 anthranilate phosphoribosyltransferase [Candidatus Omnitrophota bacterium]
MIKEATEKILKKHDLSPSEMENVFEEIMNGDAAKEDVKRFLVSLAAKPESPEEIASAAAVMRRKAVKVAVSPEKLIDTCGTGGARVNDVNVSTISAIVLAGCGLRVAKHGNRSFTGKCGSADLLEALGVNIDQKPERVAELIEKIGIGFMFAPNFHPAMKNVMEARRELKARTIFNILGPLSNPAGVKMQIIGVYKPELTEIMAEALNRLGSEKAYIVHGLEGLDEISIKGETKISELKHGKITTYRLMPGDFGIEEGSLREIAGGLPAHNADIALAVLNGQKNAVRNTVLLNAAAALKMAGEVSDFQNGVKAARESIDSGRALRKLNALKDMSSK